MTSPKKPIQAKLAALFLFVPLLFVAACGTPGTPASTGTKGPITVSSKLDNESRLIGQMYVLLLQKDGFKVNSKLAFGDTPFNFKAIQSGATDIYPEFTATGLNLLGTPSSYNPQKDYQTVKQGFQQKYNITWLNPSPLDDGYALCMSKTQSQKLGITTISQLAAKASQMTLESPSDGVPFVDALQKTYGLTTKSFKKAQTVDVTVGYTTVQDGQAQVAVCYGTDTSVQSHGLVFLQDDKNGFPAFNPAPIVRDSVLKKYPEIATVLNPLAPKLTTAVSIQLQNQVAQKESQGASPDEAIKVTAQSFLQQNHLL
ncbi:MAG TPA: glycine betaine ABC transporter substrate-binding protein [Dictyobacter sp.]|jgi:osmoprotectant transport system substrate-binding protein|nr:glycine betaine ABC transporter substrate-binding protein [Dictyobacter sp.]